MRAPGLRHQTEEAQAGFFRAELALCFTFADLAESHLKSGNPESAKSAIEKARIGLATVEGYLKDPKHARHLNDQEKQETEEEAGRLRERLKTLTAGKWPPIS